MAKTNDYTQERNRWSWYLIIERDNFYRCLFLAPNNLSNPNLTNPKMFAYVFSSK